MIDHLDDKIIEILKKDSRRPFVEIANELEVSEGTIRSRVKKLFEEGIIQSVHHQDQQQEREGAGGGEDRCQRQHLRDRRSRSRASRACLRFTKSPVRRTSWR